MISTQTLNLTASIAAFAAGALWLWASRIDIVLGVTFLSGPPKDVQDRIKRQTLLNSLAAVATAIAAILQGIALWISS